MKIACNYYRETEQLFYENKIDIDYFKYPGWLSTGYHEDLNAFNISAAGQIKRPFCTGYIQLP